MTVAIIAMSLALLGALAALGWAARRISQLGDLRADAEHTAAVSQTHAERAEFERDATQKTLTAELARSAELEAALAESIQAEIRHYNADLPADDVASRLQRRRDARRAPAAGGPIPAVAAAPLPGKPPT